jgi:phosphatidylinositol-3-phosphatase
VTRLAAVLAAAVALAAALPARVSALPPINHVFIMVLENKGFSETFGPNSAAPYLARVLPAQGALLPNYYGIAHVSPPNYLALISGQSPNGQTQSDCLFYSDVRPGTPRPDGQVLGQGCIYPAAVKTIADQLDAKGLSWKGYMEDMGNSPTQPKTCRHPTIGSVDTTQFATAGDEYAARHNPFIYFHSIIDDSRRCNARVVPLDRLPHDLRSAATTPNYVFISPNLCNDAHDPSETSLSSACKTSGKPGGLPRGDDFLRLWLSRILASPAYLDNGLVVVLFDEASWSNIAGGEAHPERKPDASACCNERPGPNTVNPGGPIPGPGGGRVGAVLISPFIKPGSVSLAPHNHYSLLRSVEDLFGLAHLGYAGQAGVRPFGAEVYNSTPRLRIRLSRKRLPLRRRRTLRIWTNTQARIYFGGRCRRKPRSTDPTGRLTIRVRARRRGRCRVLAKRTAWRPARASVRVVRVRRRR